MLPESAAVEAHGDPLSVICPVTELPVCWTVPVPVKVNPNAVDLPVICQVPVRLAPGATATVTEIGAVPVFAL